VKVSVGSSSLVLRAEHDRWIFTWCSEPVVEFVLAPQHRTSRDPVITTKEEFYNWRKWLRSLLTNLRQAKRSRTLKQRLKILTLQNIVICAYMMHLYFAHYC